MGWGVETDGRGRTRTWTRRGLILQVFILRLELKSSQMSSSSPLGSCYSQHCQHPDRPKAELNGRRDMEHLPSSSDAAWRDRKSRNNARLRGRRGRHSRPASSSFTLSLSLLHRSLLSLPLLHFPPFFFSPSGPASYFIHLARARRVRVCLASLFAQQRRRSCLQIDSEIEIKSRNGWGRRGARGATNTSALTLAHGQAGILPI